MKSKILLFSLCLLIWIGLNWPANTEWIILGVAASFLAAMITGDIFVQSPHLVTHTKRYRWLLYYFIVLAIEVIKANINIAYMVLRPKMNFNPGIVKIKTDIKSETGLTLLANSITLSSGTTTVDIDAQSGYLYVYWIDVESENMKAATERIAGKFQKILKEVFD